MAYLTLKRNFLKNISTQQHSSKNPLILYDDECVRCENQTGGNSKLPGKFLFCYCSKISSSMQLERKRDIQKLRKLRIT